MSELKGKKVTVDEDVLISRMIDDIRESDVDVLTGIIEYMYPVKVEWTDGFITIEPTDEDLNLEDIF